MNVLLRYGRTEGVVFGEGSINIGIWTESFGKSGLKSVTFSWGEFHGPSIEVCIKDVS